MIFAKKKVSFAWSSYFMIFISFLVDACATHYCDRGKACRVARDGRPLCECRPFCPRHRKLVCSTDGRLFLNHCELHRTACLEKSRIHIDRTKKCFRKGSFLSYSQNRKYLVSSVLFFTVSLIIFLCENVHFNLYPTRIIDILV